MDFRVILALLVWILERASSVEVIDVPDVGRIVGGVDSEPHSAPFIVAISVKGRQKNKQLCAGSIIAQQWIVTGAHCLKEPPYRLIITAGMHTANQTESPMLQVRRCDFYRRHEVYSTLFGATAGSDIGVAHLATPFEFTKFVQPIALHQEPISKGEASVFGWGSTSSTKDRLYPDYLQVASLTLLDVKICEYAHNTSISAGTLCAGGKANSRGACIGDSGGPLVQNELLVGIISWGPPSCDPIDGPTIFTNVGYYADWVKKQMQSDKSENNLLQ